MKIIYYLAIVTISTILISSCVSARKYQDQVKKYDDCEKENTDLRSTKQALTTEKTELEAKVHEFTKRIELLQKDTAILGKSLRIKETQYDKINDLNDELINKLEKLKEGSVTKMKELMKEYQKTQEDLLKQEDELKKLEKELNDKEEFLKDMQTDLEESKEKLKEKMQRVEELERKLSEKDSITMALKTKVSDALLGFENNGLTIHQRDGKVYVSLDEELLFASGSRTVNPKGIEAIKKLATVLEQNKDINILVEGHTDSIPYNGKSQIKDNWDLSVMRATAVAKIILDNKNIEPSRITAAGRGEYMPISTNETKEGRSKNRRTEIILTPKLFELMNLINDGNKKNED